MVRYNPDQSTQEFTKTEELRPFKGVSINDRRKVADLDIEDSAILWVQDMILLDGNVIYIEDADDSDNPFIYRSNSTGSHPPSQKHGSILISAPTGERIEFTNNRGWGQNSNLGVSNVKPQPIADDYILEQIGEEQKLLIHEI